MRKPRTTYQRKGTFENCENCGDSFKIIKEWQKFCSPKCRKTSFINKDIWKGECPECHNHITVFQKDNQLERKKK